MSKQMSKWFEAWFNSPYYHILYQNRDENEAEGFINALVNYLQPLPGSKMLDIACGEGRYTRQLANLGFDATGIDLSENSISKALESSGEHLHFYIQDMRFASYINYFDYSFNFFTSFGYFQSARDNRMAARSFAAGLKKGGTLVIDYLNIDYIAPRLVAEETVIRSGITFHINRRIEGKKIIKDIRFIDKEGNDRHYTEQVAAFDQSDFINLFKDAGLQLTGTFGNYKLGNFDPLTSPRLIMIFKK